MNPRLFSAEANGKAEEIKQFLPVNVTCSFRAIAPSLSQCERRYLLPVLGSTLFERIASFYVSEPQPQNAVLKELLQLCQYAAARLAFWKDFDVLSVSISDNGAADRAGENRLYRYQYEALKKTLKSDGFDQLDAVLEFCEQNIQSLPEFAQSPAHVSAQGTFVKTTAEFNEIHNIGNSRLVFLKMRYFITSVEELELRHRLGDSFCNELKAADATLPKYAKIIPDIRKFIVFRAVSEGVSELHRLPTEKGLLFESQSDSGGSSSSGTSENVLPAEELERVRREYEQKSERYMAAVIAALQASIADYPNYRSFATDDAPRSEVFRRDNRHRKIFHA